MPGRKGDTMVVLLCGGVAVTSWPLPGSGQPDLGLVDQLARLQLAARRAGCSIELHQVAPELSELLGLFGLADVVRSAPAPGRVGTAGPTSWTDPSS
jgi:ABC-type transporter Mla MlaB component